MLLCIIGSQSSCCCRIEVHCLSGAAPEYSVCQMHCLSGTEADRLKLLWPGCHRADMPWMVPEDQLQLTFTWYNGPSIKCRSFDAPLDFGMEGEKKRTKEPLFTRQGSVPTKSPRVELGIKSLGPTREGKGRSKDGGRFFLSQNPSQHLSSLLSLDKASRWHCMC
ncbi:hypothetical protein LOK49_LG12G01987 [Camellia lanceoleosa]|uniref:Uncharacterized protein n=1 Tax=Camellia lanceoleosa TaxID=1840588 RepID=A0ACC0FV15_9ERIC|nr:hypothetical protein LOK49_LG12G01987 [Camellia lanceoleosa]